MLNDGEQHASVESLSIYASNITAWGPQAMQHVATLSDSILVLCESHLTEPQFPDVKAYLASQGWQAFASHATPTVLPVSRSDTSPPSSTGGILIAVRAWLAAAPVLEVPPARSYVPPIGEFYAFVALRTRGLTVLVGGAYLLHSQGPSFDNLQRLAIIGNFLAQVSCPFILAGDWQMEPHELASTGFPRRIGATLVAPRVSHTCTSGKGRLIDYFLVSHDLCSAIQGTVPCLDTPWKPHLAIRLSLAAKPADVHVPVQRVPCRLQPAMGPDLPWTHFVSQAEALLASHPAIRGQPHPALLGPGLLGPPGPCAHALTAQYSMLSLACELLHMSRNAVPVRLQAMGRGQHWGTTEVSLVALRASHGIFRSSHAAAWASHSARLRELLLYLRKGCPGHPRVAVLRQYLADALPQLSFECLSDDEQYDYCAAIGDLPQFDAMVISRLSAFATTVATRLQARASASSRASFGKWVQAMLHSSPGVIHRWAKRLGQPVSPDYRVSEGRPCFGALEILESRRCDWSAVWNRVSGQGEALAAVSRLRVLASSSPRFPLSLLTSFSWRPSPFPRPEALV